MMRQGIACGPPGGELEERAAVARESEVADAGAAAMLTPMLSLLNQPGFQKRAMPLSVKAWHGMIRDGLAPKRAELIRGVIVEKMSKSILHAKLSDHLLDLFKFTLHQTHWVRQEAPLTFIDSEPEPDVSVVPGLRNEYAEHPVVASLVIEVSVSTLSEDRAMAEIYAEAGVVEYWVVNAAARRIEVYREPREGAYSSVQTYAPGQMLTCAALPVTVDVGALFAELPAAQ